MIVSMISNTSETVSITPKPCHSHFCCWLLPIWPMLAFLSWKWISWSVLAWLAVQRRKAVFFLTLYDSINDMKSLWAVCITPQPCHSHFYCWLLPIWPPLHLSRATAIFVVDCCQFGPSWIFRLIMELMACAGLVGGTTEQSCLFIDLIW